MFKSIATMSKHDGYLYLCNIMVLLHKIFKKDTVKLQTTKQELLINYHITSNTVMNFM